MASVKVAVRVRPFNQREKDMNAKLIVQMEGKKTRLLTVKNSKEQNDGSREKYKDFTFDHSYWSYDSADAQYASQEQVFADLGLDVIDSAFEGYNACVFAYGQTGSGKTFTMMGSPDSQGLIPRICRQLFSRVAAGKESGASYRTEVSYLEIYNERVKDLLATDAGHSLRVREHPKLGPYVQDLSRHLVSDYDDIQECMHRGNLHRTTASTQMNDVSSRSHAIFTITFVQASYLRHNNMPSETVSKVHLVDLAGSERADATGATGQRLVEGAHINKSLVTLGSVISALAEATQVVDSRNAKNNKKVFIPYRDSVLTWLLKDSLGGNSKTIMIAAISPADCNYGETLSTLRYANRAKNIINKPTINEDPNVKLIRELREEIEKLRAQISHNTDPIETEPAVLATLQRKEAQEKVLTEKWTEKWRETQQILQEQKALGLRKSGLGVVLDSDMPHLVGIDDNLLSTGVTLYHLKEGETLIGSEEFTPTPDIVLTGAGVLPLHCRVTLREGVATITPASGAQCWLNTVLLDKPAKLSQGCILLLGRTNMFRYNDPAEAAKLRQEGASVMNLSRLSLLSWSTTDLAASTENLNTTLSDLESEIKCERIEAQRAELERERQQFELQQEERQRRWHQEREQLLQAQRQLDEERSAMEKEYAAACRRLSGDWRALERGWTLRRRALRCRQRELSARVTRHAAAVRDVIDTIEKEEVQIADVKRRLGGKQDELEQFVREKIKELVDGGCKTDESLSPSPDSPQSETSTESLMHLLQQCEPNTAISIKETVERHKKELESLEQELQGRVASVAAHRVKIERLQQELAVLAARERGITRALADGEGESDISPSEGVKRSKSELVLRSHSDVPEPLSADEREHFRAKRLSLSLSLDPLPSPNSTLNTPDTFHTATSTPKHPSTSSVPSPSTTETSALQSDPVPVPQFRLGVAPDDSDDMSSTEDYHKVKLSSTSSVPCPSTTETSALQSDPSPVPQFRLGVAPDDSDDMSSTEDYHKVKLSSTSSVPCPSTTETSALQSDPAPVPQFRLGVAPDDSDDMSSTEDYHKVKLSSTSSVPCPSTTETSALQSDPAPVPQFRLGVAPDDSDDMSSTEDYHKVKLSSTSSVPCPSTTETSALQSDPAPVPQFRLGVAPDDSDDMSSTEDYHKPRIVEGQSSSSVERSPEERQQRTKYRRRIGESKNRRQVTEAEALRAMQRLCSRIASQKMLVISSLENDCSKEELNRQIAVLQELQKKYVRLEMALQYSFFDNQPNKRTIMVTPIQETPSLTLSESDMQVSNEAEPTSETHNGHFEDPLLNRLKETEVEASDNMSTSNDELNSEPSWPDPLRALRPPPSPHRTDHEHDYDGGRQNHRQGVQHMDYSSEGLMHPVDFADVVSVPGWVTRGAGARTHHEYEVRVRLPNASWALLRRYRRFRDLYLAARANYGEKVAAIPFPARTLWSSEALARSRRPQLETFLRRLLTVCSTDRRCPLYASPLTRESLVAFSPFFRKGVFESGKCGTG